MGTLRVITAAIAVHLLFLSFCCAEHLPVRRYTTEDGLPANTANVKRDSRGFLWFCTSEGLSRFDGYTFTNYGVADGLPDRFITDFLETRNGDYWIGTSRGLARFDPKPAPGGSKFAVHAQGKQINVLLEDSQGTIWVAADELYELTRRSADWALRRAGLGMETGGAVEGLLEDHEGTLWIATYDSPGDARLYRRKKDGDISLVSDPFFRRNRITSLFEDRQGRLWLGTYQGLALLNLHPKAGGRPIARVYTRTDISPGAKRGGAPGDGISAPFQSSDGRLWLRADRWLFNVVSDRAGRNIRFVPYGSNEEQDIGAGTAVEDMAGNLWFGTTRLARDGFVSYSRSDGLADEDVRSIFEGHDRKLYIVTGLHNGHIHRFDGGRFVPVAPMVPGHAAPWDWAGWGWGQTHFQDHLGEWWIATGHGILRYPRVSRLEDLARTPPIASYTKQSGRDIFRLYEDSRGDIWIGSWDIGLERWERATGKFHVLTAELHWRSGVPTAFREDRLGNMWIGLWGEGLARYRGGRFRVFGRSDGFDGTTLAVLLDHTGRVWAGTTHNGLVRIDDPGAEEPRFVAYTTKQGLSSDNVRALAEDRWGRIYIWTGSGLDRLEPESGNIRHYGASDGLVPSRSDHHVAFSDRFGRLWFGLDGLSRLDPQPASSFVPVPPSIRITGVRIRGVAYPVSELGETGLHGLVLKPAQNQMQIDFSGLNFGLGEVLRYQYKLEGADREWSAPAGVRSVNYAELAPGDYRFQVRALNAAGLASAAPAVLSFRVLAPVWQRGWFLALMAMTAGLGIYGAHRYRLQQVLAVERIRTRIASDLHDDIGSGLSQIAILSEVMKQEAAGREPREQLGKVAELSRGLVDSMSDIVWSINPKRDHLVDLTQRMRQLASDVLPAAGIEFEFRAPASDRELGLRADKRRQVFLIFKEAMNNIVRHAGCTRVSIEISVERHQLILRLSDNGCGFVPGSAGGRGHGLLSMERRARDLGGRLEVTSQAGQGTQITLTAPKAVRRPGFQRP